MSSVRPWLLVVAVVLATAACGGSGDDDDDASGAPTSTSVATVTSAAPSTTSESKPEPPWAGAHLDASAPHEGSDGCPPVSFADLGDGAGATPRLLGGNAGVAWDLPGAPGQNPDGSNNPTSGRSAFGYLSNPGAFDPLPSWRFRIEWSDGSVAGYGYEGETDPSTDPNPLNTTKWLAQLSIAGHDCAFNVWSNLGQDHLEHLLENLRFVDA